MARFFALPRFTLSLFILIAGLLLVSAFEIAGPEQLLPGAKEGKTCPKDLQCAQPPELEQDPVYELEPKIVTSPKVHTTSTTHTLLSKTYVAKVETVVGVDVGLCKSFVITTVKTRPTVTVWVDTTTTAHFYTSTVTTEVLTHTHTVTQTSACMKELNRRPHLLPIPDPFLGLGKKDGRDKKEESKKKSTGLGEDILKKGAKAALAGAAPQVAAAVELGEKVGDALGILEEGKEALDETLRIVDL